MRLIKGKKFLILKICHDPSPSILIKVELARDLIVRR